MNMRNMQLLKWSKSEKKIARRAFDEAYERECAALAKQVRAMAAEIETSKDLWAIHDFLWKHRRAVDDKYDYRYSVLPLVFARLIHEGWMDESDLEGLGEEKLERTRAAATMFDAL